MTIDLGVLVTSPGWAWMPGMRIKYAWGGPARDRFICADKLHAHLIVEDSAVAGVGPLTWLRKRLETFSRDCRPDLDDSATCGCLFTLVCRAWGPECRVDACVFEDGSAHIDILPADSETEITFTGDSLGLALAAALAKAVTG